jgi:hypothetical protein
MVFKNIVFYLGCATTWLFLLPVLVILGGIALTAYAVLSEMNEAFSRGAATSPDNSTAREIAHRMCVGH